MTSRIIYIEGIGDVTFTKKRQSRQVRIAVKSPIKVSVSLPVYASYDFAEKFVYEKLEWIKEQQLKIKQKSHTPTVFDLDTSFSTRKHTLKIAVSAASEIKTMVGKGLISIEYPWFMEVAEASVQQAIREAILKAWQKEAKELLPIRVAELAAKYELKFNKVKIQSSKSRWGSCSHDNNINLSLYMMQLPDHLIDYVILHELAHTIHKNHGPKFWAFLDQLTGDAEGQNAEMRKYGMDMFD